MLNCEIHPLGIVRIVAVLSAHLVGAVESPHWNLRTFA